MNPNQTGKNNFVCVLVQFPLHTTGKQLSSRV